MAPGGATDERSRVPALVNPRNAAGAGLMPPVFCVPEPADLGARHPDIGRYPAKQLSKRRPRVGQFPEREAVEAKPHRDEAAEAAAGEKEARYRKPGWRR